jgi:hypothetical protein
MNFPARVIAAVMIVTLAVMAFQSGPFESGTAVPRAEAQGNASTTILTSVMATMGKGVLTEFSRQSTAWVLSALGFGAAPATNPQLAEIAQTLDQILQAEQNISNQLQALTCATWETAIKNDVADITAKWDIFKQIAEDAGIGKATIYTNFTSDILEDGDALTIRKDLDALQYAVLPGSGNGLIDTCIASAASADPPAEYEPDSIWYNKHVLPFQNSLMMHYTRAITMVVNAYHEKAWEAAQKPQPQTDSNGKLLSDELSASICAGDYDNATGDPALQPSAYCNAADGFAYDYLLKLRGMVARGGAPYTHNHIVYYTGTDYLLARSLETYGLNTIGTYDARFPNGSGYDGYSGTWEAAGVPLFKEILEGWKGLGGKDATTAGYWLCHNTNDTSVSGNDCVGLSGLEDQIIIFPDKPGTNSDLNSEFVCFMDGKIQRKDVEGQPFCATGGGHGVDDLFNSLGSCQNKAAYKQLSFTESTDTVSDPSFYALKRQQGTNGVYCTTPGYLNLSIQKARWPAYNLNQLKCYDAFGGADGGYNPAGLRTRCGQDMEEWLDLIIPLPESS